MTKENLPKYCDDCPSRLVIDDPDPTDSFNNDYVAIVCRLTPNLTKDLNSRYASDWCDYHIITCELRPHQVKNIERPKWCPLQNENEL